MPNPDDDTDVTSGPRGGAQSRPRVYTRAVSRQQSSRGPSPSGTFSSVGRGGGGRAPPMGLPGG
jgi:hypothetical protein